jgi:methyl-accepting chemotaxis protein
MINLNNLSIAKRIVILMAGGGILLFSIAFIGWRGMAQATHGLESVYQNRAVPMVDLSLLMSKFDGVYADLLRAFQHDPEGKTYALHDHPVTEHTNRVSKIQAEMDAIWARYMAHELSDEEQPLAADFADKRKRYEETIVAPTLAALQQENFSTEVQADFLKGNRAIGGDTRIALEKLIAFQAGAAKTVYEDAEAVYARNRLLFIVFILGGFGLLGVFAWYIVRSITVSLNQSIASAEAVAGGDLSRIVPTTGARDEAGRLLAAMAKMQENLRIMVASTQQHAEQLTRSAAELNDAAGQSAHAAESQTESASSMAAAVEEMSVSIDQVRDNSREAHAVATEAGQQSRTGGQVVHSAAGEMGKIADAVNVAAQSIRELEDTSNEISSIVNVIREIADQTNLLALNAAIEAARAGEQGRGFAVVADEVRKLAERTANSTQQIAGMIDKVQAGARRAATEMESGVNRVSEGVSLAHQAGDSITGIQNGATRVATVVEDIAAALNEQASAAQDIAQGVERIAQMSEESSAAAHQTAHATQQLRVLASELQASVSRFRL